MAYRTMDLHYCAIQWLHFHVYHLQFTLTTFNQLDEKAWLIRVGTEARTGLSFPLLQDQLTARGAKQHERAWMQNTLMQGQPVFELHSKPLIHSGEGLREGKRDRERVRERRVFCIHWITAFWVQMGRHALQYLSVYLDHSVRFYFRMPRSDYKTIPLDRSQGFHPSW